ncbi:MAG: chorismate mutase [Candidatus Ancillula sp.]|jgi:chorismate mutase|nr:chorismate mutase [Candidatus Ancillula sp.]
MNKEAEEKLIQLRQEIDNIDEDIVELLVRRFAVTEEVGELKANEDLPALDSNREAKQYKRFKRMTKEYNLPNGLLKDVWAIIMNYSKNRHQEIADA